MKNKFAALFFMLFAVVSLGITSCSKDNDNEGEEPVPGQELVEGQWTEDGNKLVYKITYNYPNGIGSYTAVWTLTFNGDSCVKSECACTFSSSQLADAFYTACKEDGYPATKSGKTVTVDLTEVYEGMSKADTKAAITAMDGWA